LRKNISANFVYFKNQMKTMTYIGSIL